MMKKICAVLASIMIVANSMSTWAADMSTMTSSLKKEPGQMSAGQIIDELYADVPDKDVYACAKASSMILTGELPVTERYGRILIGSYNSVSVYYNSNLSVPLGSGKVQMSIEDSYNMYLVEEYPTQESINKNKEALGLLYNTVQQAKEETCNMNDSEKALYLTEFVNARLTKKAPLRGRTATCLFNGYADCDGFSGLYYLLAINCGLNVKSVLGTYYSESHAWNEVELGGSWKLIDTTMEKYLLSESESVQMGYSH